MQKTQMPRARGINSGGAAEGRKKDGDVKSPLQIRRAERFLSAQADPLQEQRAREPSACSARNDGRGKKR